LHSLLKVPEYSFFTHGHGCIDKVAGRARLLRPFIELFILLLYLPPDLYQPPNHQKPLVQWDFGKPFLPMLLNMGVILFPDISIPLQVEVFDEWEKYDPPFRRSAKAGYQSIEIILLPGLAEHLQVFFPDGILCGKDIEFVR
jgi:hypothetical protein